MSGATGSWLLAAAQHTVSADRAEVGTGAVLASGGGVSPEEASPGIGAFVTFILLAGIIILLAWSFTRHQRKIRARALVEEELRKAARADAAEQESARAEEPGAEGTGPAQTREAEQDEPGTDEADGRRQPGAEGD